jgi:hypothetical protein
VTLVFTGVVGFWSATRRSDFGVGESAVQGNRVVIGDAVTIELDVEAFLES